MQTGNILHVIRSIAIGGLEHQARELSAELQKLSRSDCLLLLAESEVPEKTKLWHESKIPLRIFKDAKSRFLGIDRLIRLRAYFLQQQAATIHFHYALPDGIIWNDVWAARLAGKSVVATLHHTLRWRKLGAVGNAKQLFARSAIRQFIATTQFGSDLIAARVNRRLVTTIPCIVPKTDQVGNSRREQRSVLGFSDNAFVIVCLCRTERDKGIFELVRAVETLIPRHPDLRLIIGGVGPDAEALKANIRATPEICYVGHVQDKGRLFVAADLFAMPSVAEGFGIAYVEAAQYALPSIACRLPTVAEVIMDGETGWLVESGNGDEICRVIVHALSNRGELHSRGAAAAKYASRFESERIMPALCEVYRSVE